MLPILHGDHVLIPRDAKKDERKLPCTEDAGEFRFSHMIESRPCMQCPECTCGLAGQPPRVIHAGESSQICHRDQIASSDSPGSELPVGEQVIHRTNADGKNLCGLFAANQ